MDFVAVVVAAGAGVRAGAGEAKQWRRLAGRPIVRWPAEALIAAGARELVVVVAAGDERRAADALAGLPRWRTAVGGATRSQSVRAGLAALDAGDDAVVLVHDAARPLLSVSSLQRLLAALEEVPAAILALPLADTLKRDDGAGRIEGTPDRAGL